MTQEPNEPLTISDWSNKTVVAVMLICVGIILLVYFVRGHRNDSAAITYLNAQADSLRGAVASAETRAADIELRATHLIDTVLIIEKPMIKRYDNYIQETTLILSDTSNVKYFIRAEARFDSLFREGFFTRK